MSHGHHFKREALPWWIFGVLGGVLAVWYAPPFLAGRFGLLRVAGRVEPRPRPSRSNVLGRHRTLLSCAGSKCLKCAPVGWMIIRPVNAVLGWLFRGFNRLFDAITSVYGWTVGKLLRVSFLVLARLRVLCWE